MNIKRGNSKVIAGDYSTYNGLKIGLLENHTYNSSFLRFIEDKKINMVLTKDTSRLGRDHIEFGYYVEKYFPAEAKERMIKLVKNLQKSSELIFLTRQ